MTTYQFQIERVIPTVLCEFIVEFNKRKKQDVLIKVFPK